MCADSLPAMYHATPPSSTASVTRSTVESKNAPRWLDVLDAFANAPSKRSGRAARITRIRPSHRRPDPMANAAPTPTTNPTTVRWSGVRPVLRSASPTGRTAFSTGFRKLPSNTGPEVTAPPARPVEPASARRSQTVDLVTVLLDIETLGDQIA